MSDFYADLRDGTAAPLIEEFGAAVTLKRPGSSALYDKAFDPATGGYKWTLIAEPHTVVYVDPAVAAEYPGHAIIDQYAAGVVDGDLIRKGDLRLFVVGIVDPIEGTDRITVLGRDREVVKSIPLCPGGVTLLWEVQAR